MVITSKNGFKLDISPKRWWNILDLIAWIKEIIRFKKSNVYLSTKDWQMVQGYFE